VSRVLALLIVLLAGCGADSGADDAAQSELTVMEQARVDCRLPSSSIGDEGTTLLLDHKGEEDTTGLSFDQIACVMAELNVSDALAARIGSTRAMDGVQSGEWDGYTATWSYHPDTGLDMIVEAAQ
jgi:hypothetical protein